MTTDETQRPILVGIDGSANSLAALRWALREGLSTGSPVEVVHCWRSQTLTDIAFAPQHELHTASVIMLQNEVAAAVAEVAGTGEVPEIVRTSLHGNASSVLVARSADARVVVLGSRQTTAMSDLFHRTVEASCRKHAACPVVTIDRNHVVTWHQPDRHQAVAG